MSPGSSPELVVPDERPAHPNTGHTPERVLRTFLEGVREPDVPDEADGLRTAYHLASPAYRKRAGAFEGFREQLSLPLFSPLVGHQRAERGAVTVNDAATEATQEILVATAEDEDAEYMYEFTLGKQSDGKYEGCWLVEDVVLTMSRRRPGFQHMPTVQFDGTEIKCQRGAVLRDVLLRTAGINPHNDQAAYANCSGNGLCGTCAVGVENPTTGANVSQKTGREKRRLSLPPLRDSDVPNLRLSCQTRVLDDVRVAKHEGLWGQHLSGIEAETDRADASGGTTGGRVIEVSPEEYEHPT